MTYSKYSCVHCKTHFCIGDVVYNIGSFWFCSLDCLLNFVKKMHIWNDENIEEVK